MVPVFFSIFETFCWSFFIHTVFFCRIGPVSDFATTETFLYCGITETGKVNTA
jgi:hypothetical protein